jgi:hypothetical protein
MSVESSKAFFILSDALLEKGRGFPPLGQVAHPHSPMELRDSTIFIALIV